MATAATARPPLFNGFVLVLTAATIISFVDRYLPSVLIDSVRRDIALTDVQFTTLQTAFALTYAFATLAGGWIADRTNRLRLLVGGVTLWAVGTALFGLADDLGQMLTGRILIGLGEAVLGPAGISLLCDYLPPKHRGKAIALTYFGATLGTSLAFGGGGWLLGHAEAGAFAAVPWLGELSGWRQVALILGAIGLPLIPLLLLFREPARRQEASEQGGYRDLIPRWPLLWPILLTGLTVAVADFAYTSWQTPLMTRTYGWTTSAAGQYLGITALIAGTAGAWIGGLLADRAQRRTGAAGRIGVVSWCAVGLLGSALLLLVPFAWGAIAAFAAWQMIANVAYVACAVTLVELVTSRTRALTSGLSVSLSIGIGLGFGPTSVAALNQWLGGGGNALVPSLLIMLGAMGTGTLLLSLLLRRRLMRA